MLYNSDGSLDESFASSGWFIKDFSGGNDWASCISVQGDGKILIGGSAYDGEYQNFALIRLTKNGALDTSFGTNGIVSFDFIGSGADDSISAIVVQADGKIVASGTSENSFAIARFNEDGSFDTAFGTNGKATISDSGQILFATTHLILEPDGKLVFGGGSVDRGTEKNRFALTRVTSDGSIDLDFGTSGLLTYAFSPGVDNFISDITMQPDGKFVAVGFVDTNLTNTAIARFNNDGSLDTSFNGSGKLATYLYTGETDYAQGVIIQSDGKIAVAGGGSFAFSLMRIWP